MTMHRKITHAPPGLVVDLFAGGGGASTGLEQAMGRPVDIAINHDPEAVALHQRNHPFTRHFVQDIFEVDPVEATGGKPVAVLWASPDCKHFSKARGGAPVSKRVRSLAWVVCRWAGQVRPAVILMENVEEFTTWGPLIVKRDPDTGSPMWDADGRPVMIPDPKRRGQIFRAWVAHLRRLGYAVEWRELVAADYGAPTTRKRLYLIARCDGEPIVWPRRTHADARLPADQRVGFKVWRSAASIIDWDVPCPSIFMDAVQARAYRAETGITINRPLKPKTLARIAEGVRRYVLDHPRPFIVPVTHGKGHRSSDSREPLRTITTANGGEFAFVAPVMATHYGQEGGRSRDPRQPVATITTRGTQSQVIAPLLVPRYGERPTQAPRALDPSQPHPTVVPTQNGAQLVAAFLAQHNTGVVGHETSEPLSTIVGKGCTQAVVAASLSREFGRSTGSDATEPVPTITAGGSGKVGLVTAHLGKIRGSNKKAAGGDPTEPVDTITAGGGHWSVVAAFLQSYHRDGGQHADPSQPMPTVATRTQLSPVTVVIDGVTRVLVDIGMRMFRPRELYRAQGFPDSYIIDAGLDGAWLSKQAQIRMCGNSVCPPVAFAIAAANLAPLTDSPTETKHPQPRRRQTAEQPGLGLAA